MAAIRDALNPNQEVPMDPIVISAGTFSLSPVDDSNVVEVRRQASGFFVGLLRRLDDGFRAHGVDGWETFTSVELAVAAVARRSEPRW